MTANLLLSNFSLRVVYLGRHPPAWGSRGHLLYLPTLSPKLQSLRCFLFKRQKLEHYKLIIFCLIFLLLSASTYRSMYCEHPPKKSTLYLGRCSRERGRSVRCFVQENPRMPSVNISWGIFYRCLFHHNVAFVYVLPLSVSTMLHVTCYISGA
jgi:hypothetical protein